MWERKSILIVDDQETNRAILHRLLEGEYTILEAQDGVEAIEKIKCHENELALILLDIVMPNMNGYDVVHFMENTGIDKNIPVILITADVSSISELKDYAYRVTEVLTKPFDVQITRRRVHNTIELYENKRGEKAKLSEKCEKLEHTLSKQRTQYHELMQYYKNTCENFCAVLSKKTKNDTPFRRVKAFTSILCKYVLKEYPEYRLTGQIANKIIEASVFYDVGMFLISDEILQKPGKLTKEEHSIMETHTTKGVDILHYLNAIADKDTLTYASDICRYHHERYDGKGYPEGLVGDEIPIGAQIVSIAEAYTALLRKVSYRDAYSQVNAEKMILEGKCGCFNPKLLDCFHLGKEEMRAIIIKTDKKQ